MWQLISNKEADISAGGICSGPVLQAGDCDRAGAAFTKARAIISKNEV